jgi:hypothetical protein
LCVPVKEIFEKERIERAFLMVKASSIIMSELAPASETTSYKGVGGEGEVETPSVTNFALRHKWILWYHGTEDNQWTIESYKKVFEIKTYYDLLFVLKHITNVSSGMFFVMKDGIRPVYEDPQNMTGGYWSMRLLKKDAFEYYKKILYYMCIEGIMKNQENNDKINGLSISPKINNCIFKIWNSDYEGLRTNDLRTNIPGLSHLWEHTYYLQHKE